MKLTENGYGKIIPATYPVYLAASATERALLGLPPVSALLVNDDIIVDAIVDETPNVPLARNPIIYRLSNNPATEIVAFPNSPVLGIPTGSTDLTPVPCANKDTITGNISLTVEVSYMKGFDPVTAKHRANPSSEGLFGSILLLERMLISGGLQIITAPVVEYTRKRYDGEEITGSTYTALVPAVKNWLEVFGKNGHKVVDGQGNVVNEEFYEEPSVRSLKAQARVEKFKSRLDKSNEDLALTAPEQAAFDKFIAKFEDDLGNEDDAKISADATKRPNQHAKELAQYRALKQRVVMAEQG